MYTSAKLCISDVFDKDLQVLQSLVRCFHFFFFYLFIFILFYFFIFYFFENLAKRTRVFMALYVAIFNESLVS